jgi:diguanylate cyclase (GGDEF)-like protein
MPSPIPNESLPQPAYEIGPGQVPGTGSEVNAVVEQRDTKQDLQPVDLPRRVLLVEPSPTEGTWFRNQLIAGQIEVYLASDLISATRALSIFQPNLILAQLRLPTYTGLELVRQVKSNHATRLTPVILYCNAATADECVKALNTGAVDLLTKPFVSAELVARVRAALKARHTLAVFEQRAHLDSLTGLANRGVFDDYLAHEWHISRRRRIPLSVVIADLDHFKAINDSLGHLAGDSVLRYTASVLVRSVRSSDLVARYGGEEFAVIAPDCSLPAAVMLAERFRLNLRRHGVSSSHGAVSITTSVGIATTDWTQHGPAELLRQADGALYQAKRSGRDTVRIYTSSREEACVTVGTDADIA